MASEHAALGLHVTARTAISITWPVVALEARNCNLRAMGHERCIHKQRRLFELLAP